MVADFNNDSTIFAAIKNPASRKVEIFAKQKRYNGQVSYWKNVIVETVSENDPDYSPAVYAPPPMQFSYEDAQSLMDALWDAGIKPSGGEGHTAHIRALNDHLDSMKKIAFNQLGIK